MFTITNERLISNSVYHSGLIVSSGQDVESAGRAIGSICADVLLFPPLLKIILNEQSLRCLTHSSKDRFQGFHFSAALLRSVEFVCSESSSYKQTFVRDLACKMFCIWTDTSGRPSTPLCASIGCLYINLTGFFLQSENGKVCFSSYSLLHFPILEVKQKVVNDELIWGNATSQLSSSDNWIRVYFSKTNIFFPLFVCRREITYFWT